MQIKLKLIFPNGRSSVRSYKGATLCIGRAPECEITVEETEHSSASWIHARIIGDRDSLFLHDVNSKNGTYVNEQRVDGTVQLRVGDVIQLGRKGPKYVLLEAASDAASEQPVPVAPMPTVTTPSPPSPVPAPSNETPRPFPLGTHQEWHRKTIWIGGTLLACILLLLLIRAIMAPTVVVVKGDEVGKAHGDNGQQEQHRDIAGGSVSEKNDREDSQERKEAKPSKPESEAPKSAHKESGQPRPEPAEPTAPMISQEDAQAQSLERRLGQAIYLVQLEKYNEFLPFATCCAINENTLITTAREAAQLVKWRKNGTFHRIWITNQTGSIRREVEEIRAHRTFVKLAKDGDLATWIYFDFALLTVKEKLPTFVPLASADDLKGLDNGAPLLCLGFSHDGKKISKHNLPRLQAGKNNRIYTITAIPSPADLPSAGEPVRLLHMEGEIPHESIEVPSSDGKVTIPAYGSPVFNEQGRLVAVYADTMEPGKEQQLLLLHYAPVINPALINLWLQKEDTQTWVLPDVLPTPSEPAHR